MSRSRVIVEFPDRHPYAVRIGSGLAAEVGATARALAPAAERCLVVCDAEAQGRCLPVLKDSLGQAGFRVADVAVPALAPEQAWDCVGELHRALAQLALPPGAPLVVCAGVEMGQLACFATSLYGSLPAGGVYPLLVVPASLAGAVLLLGVDAFEVDAGFDVPLSTPARPAQGLVDPALLACADAGEREAGLLELEQASLHCDADYRVWQEEHREGLLALDPDACVLALTQVLAARADAIGQQIAANL